jgi:hypothetical protein
LWRAGANPEDARPIKGGSLDLEYIARNIKSFYEKKVRSPE